jgi:peptidyl-prolyl cis-trans isomerase D
MLEMLRRGVRSWLVKVLLGLLVASFAVWGIGDIGAGFTTRVASVGERDIDASLYGTTLRQQQQRFGLDPSQIRSSGLDRFVLGQMVREAALEESARRLGLSAPDSAVARTVRTNPAFRIGGNFDATQYASAVRRLYPSVAAFEESVRRALAAEQIARGATGGTVAPNGAARAIARFREEQRVFETVVLDAPATPLAEPTEADLTAHLDANPDRFAEPETRDVTWLHIDPAALAAGIAIDEAALREAYEARAGSLRQPETRRIEQIVYDDMATAQAAADRVAAGEASFDDLLAEQGLTREAATLGTFEAGELPGARGEAAFALDDPGIAGPVPTPGGAALIEVRAITPARSVPFDSVADELRQELARERAQPDADRLAEEVEDLRAGGATLEEIAPELGLTLHAVEGLAETGAGAEAGSLAATPAFLTEAFAAGEDEERRITAAPDGGYFVLRVDAVNPASVPALVEIRDAVAESWQREARREALIAEAEALVDDLGGGGTLTEIAQARGLSVTTVGPLRRTDPDPRLGSTARAVLFAAQPGAAAVSTAAAGIGVAVLREVIPALADSAMVQDIERALAQSLALDQLDYLGRALEEAAGVSVNQGAIDAVLAQIGG